MLRSTIMALAVISLNHTAEFIVDGGNAKASDTNAGSADAPLKSIQKGVDLAGPGDTVTVKAGIYREKVVFRTAGTADQRITLRRAPGERVLLNGALEVRGWKPISAAEGRGNPQFSNIHVAELELPEIEKLDDKYRKFMIPNVVFEDGRPLRVSRFPAGSRERLALTGGDKSHVVDDKTLNQPAGFWDGGILTVRHAKSTNYDRALIASYAPDKHELTSAVEGKEETDIKADSYWVTTLVSIIAEPGMWAIDTSKKPFRLYLWPHAGEDPNKHQIEVTRLSPAGISWEKTAKFITIDGFEVCHFDKFGIGNESSGGSDIEIFNCVSFHNIALGRASGGMVLSGVSNALIKNNVCTANFQDGIELEGCKNIQMIGNDIYGNLTDGVKVAWHSSNILFKQNFVHKQWGFFHPDGFQTFSGVTDLTLDSNAFLDVGQGWQCEGTKRVKLFNNIWVGTHHSGLSLSMRDSTAGQKFFPCSEFTMDGNTFAFPGYGLMGQSQSDTLSNNIFHYGKGGGGSMYGGTFPWTEDYCIFSHYGPKPIMWDGKYVTFEEYRKLSNNGAHSFAGEPGFINAPARYTALKTKNVGKNTKTKFHIEISPKEFAVGDHVELNWDGVVRKVTEVGDEYIAIDPGTDKPNEMDVIANWKDKKDFTLDMRLAKDSVGKGKGKDGRDIGSLIDLQAYKAGDFDGDGKRDVPVVPKEAAFAGHIIWE